MHTPAWPLQLDDRHLSQLCKVWKDYERTPPFQTSAPGPKWRWMVAQLSNACLLVLGRGNGGLNVAAGSSQATEAGGGRQRGAGRRGHPALGAGRRLRGRWAAPAVCHGRRRAVQLPAGPLHRCGLRLRIRCAHFRHVQASHAVSVRGGARRPWLLTAATSDRWRLQRSSSAPFEADLWLLTFGFYASGPDSWGLKKLSCCRQAE